MSISANASLEFEAGQTVHPNRILLDSGDHRTFNAPAAPWSNADGFQPEVHPDGIETGGQVIPARSSAEDAVDVEALSCYLAGVQVLVAADADVTVFRGTDTDTHRITSVTVNAFGEIAPIAGMAGTAFTETRGEAGGPPFIPVGSIEIAQVRLTSITPAPVTLPEICCVWGQHSERWGYPAFEIDRLNGSVTFAQALPLNHTGNTPKNVSARYATPVFQAVARALDFVPIERSFSQTSQEYYGGSIGGGTESLSQGKFTALLEDGHCDALLSLAGNTLTFRFKQDRNRAPYSLTQGRLGISRTYPKTAQVQAACTLSGEKPTRDYPR